MKPRFQFPGDVVVRLPDPTDTSYLWEDEEHEFLGWEVQEGPYMVSVHDQGEVQVSYDGNVGEPISVEHARDLAAALLAAAEAASK